MAICEATGPRAIVWCAPWRVVAVAWASKVCGTPCEIRITATTIDSGSRM